MRRPKNFLALVIFLVFFIFGSPAIRSFENAYGEEKQECRQAAELTLEFLDAEDGAFEAVQGCLPTSENPDCQAGKLDELIRRSEMLKKKVIETAHACLGK